MERLERKSAMAENERIVGPGPVDRDAAATVGPTDTFEFRASGGDGSYTWSLSSTSYGDISSSSGDKIVYSANGMSVSAQIVLTVTSDSENEVAIITHTP